MSKATDYIDSIVVGGVLSLSSYQARYLQSLLNEDAKDFYYSAFVSFSDAVRGARSGFYSWATVKLYYSCFYLLKAKMAINGEIFYYLNKKPKLVKAGAGGYLQARGDNSHKLVLNHCKDNVLIHPILNQEIDSEPLLEWYAKKRELVNYKMAKYHEPNVPDFWEDIDDLRRWVSFCISKVRNGDFSLGYDPRVAILALPIVFLVDFKNDFLVKGIYLSGEDVSYLKGLVKDEYGSLLAADIL